MARVAVEEWRPIPDWDGYEASSLGRVRTWRTSARTGEGRAAEPKVLRHSDAGGRPLIGFCVKRRRKGRQVGAWVLLAFVGPPPGGTECSHLNGDPFDNRIENLAWETHAQNMARKRDHGTLPGGPRYGRGREWRG